MITQRKLTVTLETVTPMFLAGANQKVPELRAPSFMGALRYWTRAALGGVLGDRNLKGLKETEAEIFGSTAGSGAVSIRISQPAQSLDIEDVNPLLHKTSRFQIQGFKAKQKFQLTLAHLRGSDAAWEAAVTSLLLMLAHGGVGRRSRRGWGTLRIAGGQVSDADAKAMWARIMRAPVASLQKGSMNDAQWKNYRSLVSELAIEAASSLCRELGLQRTSPAFPSKYPIISLDSQEITNTILKKNDNSSYASYEEAIKDFGKREHQFGISSAFGSANPRWASPLWVRVLPVRQPDSGFVLGVTILKSENRNADYGRLEEFIQKWPELEVCG